MEAILREELRKYGCAVELHKELIGMVQDEDGVTAEVRDNGNEERQLVRSSYLVGADGGKGMLRSLAFL